MWSTPGQEAKALRWALTRDLISIGRGGRTWLDDPVSPSKEPDTKGPTRRWLRPEIVAWWRQARESNYTETRTRGAACSGIAGVGVGCDVADPHSVSDVLDGPLAARPGAGAVGVVLVVQVDGLGQILSPNPPMDGARTGEGGKGVTGAMIRARIRVDGRLAGGLQALLGAPMSACSGCGERDGRIGHGKRRSRTGMA